MVDTDKIRLWLDEFERDFISKKSPVSKLIAVAEAAQGALEYIIQDVDIPYGEETHKLNEALQKLGEG